MPRIGGGPFLFYGWFDDVILTEDRWINRRKDRYVIWGWLQVGHVFLAPTASDTPEWLHYHPHVMDSTKPKNRIYSASESLELSGELMKCRAGGIFGREHSVRCLTHTAGQRGLYPDNLPPWLAVKGNEVDPGNWTAGMGVGKPTSERSPCPRNDVSTVPR
ncbi:MAG: hypothetical protein JNK23_21245 [Opitutaceae bacterium]|nr:hypothetical protein [Opitutaceae bacterium]